MFIIAIAGSMCTCMRSQEKKSEYNSQEIIIKFTPSTDSSRIDSLCREMNIEKIRDIPGIKASLYRIKSQSTPEEIISKHRSNPVSIYGTKLRFT
jgi:hypothetical protein